MAENNENSREAPETPDPKSVDRRHLLTGSAAVATAIFASGRAGGQEMQGADKAKRDKSVTDTGPENKPVRDVSPNAFLPPDTDHGEVQTFWSSFSSAHRRIQEGGWSRQVTVEDFPISKDIAGVNMRLTAGGIRELHWHNAAEWALMLTGRARITAIDNDGRSFVKDVGVNDLWFFPTGTPHSIQGLAPMAVSFSWCSTMGSFRRVTRL